MKHFSSLFRITDKKFENYVSDENKKLLKDGKVFRLRLNNFPALTSDYEEVYDSKIGLCKDLMELAYDHSLIDEIFKYKIAEIGFAIKSSTDDDSAVIDYFLSALNDRFWINFQEYLSDKIELLRTEIENIIEIQEEVFTDTFSGSTADLQYVNSDLRLDESWKYLKYIGPLRNLNNFEERVFKYDQNTPLGLSGDISSILS